MRYVVYTEVHDNGISRWYYGTYETRNEANEVAASFNDEWPRFHCVCREDETEDFGIIW